MNSTLHVVLSNSEKLQDSYLNLVTNMGWIFPFQSFWTRHERKISQAI